MFDKILLMKVTPVPAVATAVFAATIPFIKEHEDPKCKNAPCAIEMVATVPDLPHSPEEPPVFESPSVMVQYITTSPVTTVALGSALHYDLIRRGFGEGSIVNDGWTMKLYP